MSEYTAGPWSYGEGTRTFNIRAVTGMVATVKKNLYTENERTEADARLIAAAPELLAELQDVLDWAKAERAPLREQEIASIQAVITKATRAPT